MTGDYYEILGVPRTATGEEVQRAYRQLARKFHPDVNKDPAAEDRFKDITEAYDVLSNPESRKKYDKFGADWRRVPEGAAAGHPGGGWNDGGVWTSAGRGARPADRMDAADFEDLFGSYFGGRGGGFGRGPVPGADTEAELTLTVEEAYAGGRRGVTLQGPSGARTYDVNIPAGVTDGQRIRLAGQGARGAAGGQPGDLYLRVRLAPHPRYRLDGRDLTVPLPLTPWEATLGATVPVPTPGGPAEVKVPAGSSSGRLLRLRGKGMPNPRGQAGDLYAEVRIVVPPEPSAEERALFEQLATVSSFDPRSR